MKKKTVWETLFFPYCFLCETVAAAICRHRLRLAYNAMPTVRCLIISFKSAPDVRLFALNMHGFSVPHGYGYVFNGPFVAEHANNFFFPGF